MCARSLLLLGGLAGIVVAGGACGPCAAASLEAAPTTIELSPGNGAGVLYIANRGSEAVAFQIEAFDWSQASGEDRLRPTADLEFSPPIAELAPGATQLVRLRARDAGASGERAYRLVVSELPPPGGGGGQQIRVLLQFNLPVFEHAATAARPAVAWSAALADGRLVVTATNTGGQHGKFIEPAVIDAARGRHAFAAAGPVYVLAGATRTWTVAATGFDGERPVALEGRDADSGKPVAIPLAVRP